VALPGAGASISVEITGPGLAALRSVGPTLNAVLGKATQQAALETLQFGRAVMRGALGLRAANTIFAKQIGTDPEKPDVWGVFSRWVKDGKDIPYAFSVGATVLPRRSKYLAVPTAQNRFGAAGNVDYAAGSIGAGIYVAQPHGGRDSLGRFMGGRDWQGRRRMNPVDFAVQSGVGLRYVPPRGGRRYGMLVADISVLSGVDKGSRLPSGRVGSRRRTNVAPRTHKITVPMFILLPRTTVPQLLPWDEVVEYGQQRLQADVTAALPPNILDAFQTGYMDSVPLYEVVVS
jgi:hypothetical protein